MCHTVYLCMLHLGVGTWPLGTSFRMTTHRKGVLLLLMGVVSTPTATRTPQLGGILGCYVLLPSLLSNLPSFLLPSFLLPSLLLPSLFSCPLFAYPLFSCTLFSLTLSSLTMSYHLSPLTQISLSPTSATRTHQLGV